jgi:ankyrin repeat protein
MDGGRADIELKYELMKALVDAGCELNARDLAGNNITQAAITSGMFWAKSYCALRAIIQLGSDVSTANFQGRTALHTAAAVLADTYSSTRNASEASALQFVLHSEYNFNINAQDNRGITALHIAAETSEINVWLLIQAGADIGIIG